MKHNKNKGFTLIEASVGVLVVSLIMLALISIFRYNLSAFKHGEENLDFMQKNQLVIKQIFTDLKNINPSLNDINLRGETSGKIFVNPVRLTDTDDNFDNGFEYMRFTLCSDLDEPDEPKNLTQHEYYIKNHCLYRTEKGQSAGSKLKKIIIAKHISEIHFFYNRLDAAQVKVTFKAKDDKTNKEEAIDFTVRLESNLVCAKPSFATNKAPYEE